MTLCDTFKRLSLDTWDMIYNSRRTNFQLKEETITDLNILELKSRHPRQIATTVFTKREEGRNGADWEWWFRSVANRWIGLRIQAKIINIQTGAFDHLHYLTSTAIYQCDNFITHALRGPYPTIPLYCFYIHTNDKSHLTKWPCGTLPFIKDLYGCSLTSALTVRKLRAPMRKHLADIQDNLKPWHCLACCTNFGSGDLVSNIEAYARANFDLDQASVSGLDDPVPDVFSTNRPPPYVSAIFEGQLSEIIAPDDDIDGIVVYDEQGLIPS